MRAFAKHNYAQLTGPPALLKLGVLGALLPLKFFSYCGAGVKGACAAGVAIIMKKGGDSSVCSLINSTARLFYHSNENENIRYYWKCINTQTVHLGVKKISW